MTKHELASFALKLLGIYTIIQSLPLIQFLGGALEILHSSKDGGALHFGTLIGMFIPFLLMALVGAVLLVFSRELAPRLVGEDKPLNVSSALTAPDVQAVGFSIVAVLIFLEAIPKLGQAVWSWSYAASQPWASQMSRGVWQYGLSAGIQLVLAVVLFLQAGGLANVWHRIQIGRYVRVEDAGQSKTPEPDGR